MNGVQVCGDWQLVLKPRKNDACHASGFVDAERCSCTIGLIENARIYFNSRFSFEVSL